MYVLDLISSEPKSRGLLRVEQPVLKTDKSSPVPLTTKLRRQLLVARRVARLRCVQFGLLLALLASGAWHYIPAEWLAREHVSCPRTQPLVRVYPSFLPEATFASLSRVLPNHPLITQNQLNEESFHNTTGWIVKFNREGLARLRSTPAYVALVPYLDSVVRPESNAFVLNLLVCGQQQDWHPGKLAVGPHVDDTVAMSTDGEWYFGDNFLAHQVNVLYTNVPAHMQGGNLEVWAEGGEKIQLGKAIVQPEENTMVEFRGDAYHRVMAFTSPSGESRLSLVLEQYRIQPAQYHRTITFCENENCGALEAGSL